MTEAASTFLISVQCVTLLFVQKFNGINYFPIFPARDPHHLKEGNAGKGLFALLRAAFRHRCASFRERCFQSMKGVDSCVLSIAINDKRHRLGLVPNIKIRLLGF